MMVWPTFNYYEIARGILTPSHCAWLMSLCRASPPSNGAILGYRSCDLWWLPRAQHPSVFDNIISAAAKLNPGLDADGPIGQAQVARYTPGQRYDWHMDLGGGAMSLRKLTIVTELQSAEQGGGLEVFPMGSVGLTVGDVAVMPSFVMHRAAPVEVGERWSLTLWLTGQEPLR
jgi:hypothetical protein